MIEHFQKRAAKYEERSGRGLWKPIRERELACVIEELKPEAGERLLELGCGAGFYARRLQALGMRVTGVDSSPAMLETLKESGVQTVLGDAALYRGEERFEKVLAAGLLEFVVNPNRVFAAAREALVKNGVFVILIPTRGMIGALYKATHACPVFIRQRSLYIDMAKKEGFEMVSYTWATPLSEVLSFRLK